MSKESATKTNNYVKPKKELPNYLTDECKNLHNKLNKTYKMDVLRSSGAYITESTVVLPSDFCLQSTINLYLDDRVIDMRDQKMIKEFTKWLEHYLTLHEARDSDVNEAKCIARTAKLKKRADERKATRLQIKERDSKIEKAKETARKKSKEEVMELNGINKDFSWREI